MGAFIEIQKETTQEHSVRKPLLEKIKELRKGRAIISFFISFHSPVPLSNMDADIIEEIISELDTSKGVTLILNAPGGDGLTAERIIQICRSYSGADFETIVASKAKSAATMVCLGSDQILMSPTSELGPIDPQIPYRTGKSFEWIPAHHVIKTYDELFQNATNLDDSKQIEPYLQQLADFKASEIEQFRSSQKLALSIAISSLKSGMMNKLDEKAIEEKIKPFTDPEVTFSHGRALNYDQAQDCGLKIELVDLNSELWRTIWSLYMRSKHVVDSSKHGKKLVETIHNSFISG